MTIEYGKEATLQELSEVNRVEVIDNSGRAYVNMSAKDVAVSIQDNGRTLKVFLRDKK